MTRPAGTYAIFETSQGNIVIKTAGKRSPQNCRKLCRLAEGTREFTNEKTGKERKAPFL